MQVKVLISLVIDVTWEGGVRGDVTYGAEESLEARAYCASAEALWQKVPVPQAWGGGVY